MCVWERLLPPPEASCLPWGGGGSLRSMLLVHIGVFFVIFLQPNCGDGSVIDDVPCLSCVMQAPWSTGTECVAKYNFQTANEQDLPFCKGDVLTIIGVTRVSLVSKWKNYLKKKKKNAEMCYIISKLLPLSIDFYWNALPALSKRCFFSLCLVMMHLLCKHLLKKEWMNDCQRNITDILVFKFFCVEPSLRCIHRQSCQCFFVIFKCLSPLNQV